MQTSIFDFDEPLPVHSCRGLRIIKHLHSCTDQPAFDTVQRRPPGGEWNSGIRVMGMLEGLFWVWNFRFVVGKFGKYFVACLISVGTLLGIQKVSGSARRRIQAA